MFFVYNKKRPLFMKKFFVLFLFLLAPSFASADTYVSYFHTTYRCPICNRVEAWTKDAIRGMNVKFNSVDIALPENQHYIPYFDITSKVVVISNEKGDYKQLSNSWDYARDVDQDTYINYIRNEVRDFKNNH